MSDSRFKKWQSYRQFINCESNLVELIINEKPEIKEIINKNNINFDDINFLKNFSNQNLQDDPLNLKELIRTINEIEKKQEIENTNFDESMNTHEFDIIIKDNFNNIELKKNDKDETIDLKLISSYDFNHEKSLEMKKINIAIDGPSGVGKSSLAKKISEKLNMVFINTGLIYRVLAFYFSSNKIDYTDNEILRKELEKIELDILSSDKISLNHSVVKENLYLDEISTIASIIAQNKYIRSFCTKIAQNKSISKGVIMEGRDIASVVLPNAEVKIFLTANDEVRAKRRYEQLMDQGFNVNYDELLQQLKDRDKRDKERINAPLVKTEDAIEIDTSNLTFDEVFEEIYLISKKVMSANE